MPTQQPSTTTSSSPDDEFQALLAEYLARIERDGSAALDDLRARHPKFASKLGHQVEWLVERLGRRKEGVPDRIGPYRVIQQLGAGGMGEVYLAEQTTPFRRVVAVKVIKVGKHDDARVRRFASEIQILAMLNHDCIAKVFEAGSDDGRPYFAMEYVPGKSLTDYCAEERLGVAPRLQLFLEVCQAVEHAHRHGILHRDLKPSNILVYGPATRPVVKIIDFGLAKVIEREPGIARATQTGQLVGTPDYMSPEQVDSSGGRHIDTRADVYALGVVLYELLTGVLPLSLYQLGIKDLQELVAAIREREPSSPSVRVGESGSDSDTSPSACTGVSPRRLSRQLAGDLDSIVMKALAKNVDRRYGSVTQFAEDIQRYLRHEPVRARVATTGYVLRKFLRRHRVAATVAASATALVLTSLVTINVYALESIAHLERGNLFGLCQYLQQLRVQDGTPPPARPEHLGELERLLREYEQLLAQRDRMRAHRDAPATASLGASDPDGWANGGYADEVLRDEIDYTLDLLQKMTRPGAELDELRLRIDWARRVRELTVDAYRSEWQRVRSEVLADDRFLRPDGRRLDLTPQVGLMPLRRNPESGLQEFALLLPGGELPRPGERGYRIGPKTCPVFVLLPGGRVWVGAQDEDAAGFRHDPARQPGEAALHQVDLEPFFAGCHELTNGLWSLLLAGEHDNPEQPPKLYEPPHPLVDVSGEWMQHVLLAWGMRLPTRDEWEYMARAGSDAPYWCGDVASLQGNANLLDTDAQLQDVRGEGPALPWPDGYPLTAPVGAFAANAFHLHDVHGNATEVAIRTQRDDGTLALELHGGSWHQGPAYARVTAHTTWDGRPLSSIGVRPVISVQQ